MTLVRCLILFALLVPTLADARPKPQPKPQNAARNVQTGFKAEFLANLADVESKLLELAESTPADKYTWRPAADVRSISEVYMHVAGANYLLSSFVGADAPKTTVDREKSITRKAAVIAELRRSFDHLRAAAIATNDLDAAVRMFGNQTTHRGVLITCLNHLHEHLGQSIAYARMNGVVPPWSR